METQQVLNVLKPKAASFGFNDEELREASEKIAELHPEEATEDEVAAVVDNHLPFLKLSQSAANRSFERMKAQFEKDNPKPKKTPEQEEAERKAKEEEAERKKKEEKEMPEWAKAQFAAYEKRIKAMEDENDALKAERTTSDFRKAATKALEGVDESYYSLALESAKFEKQEDVDNFVQKVKDGWDAMSKKLKIGNLSSVKPPKVGIPAADKPSKDVQDRIERRKKSAAIAAPIRGLEAKK